jgi:hypothetical protein
VRCTHFLVNTKDFRKIQRKNIPANAFCYHFLQEGMARWPKYVHNALWPFLNMAIGVVCMGVYEESNKNVAIW